MNLYQLTTKGLGQFYVIAGNPHEAQNCFAEKIGEADYGTSEARFVTNIAILAGLFKGTTTCEKRLIVCFTEQNTQNDITGTAGTLDYALERFLKV